MPHFSNQTKPNQTNQNETLVIGTGLMGAPIATRLADKDFEVTAWNRSKSARSGLGDNISFSDDLQQTVKKADVLLLLLSDAKAISEVIFTLPKPFLEGKTIVQMGTIAPQESRGFLAQAGDLGGGGGVSRSTCARQYP